MLKWGFTFYKLFTQQQTTLQSALSLFSNGFTETYSPRAYGQFLFPPLAYAFTLSLFHCIRRSYESFIPKWGRHPGGPVPHYLTASCSRRVSVYKKNSIPDELPEIEFFVVKRSLWRGSSARCSFKRSFFLRTLGGNFPKLARSFLRGNRPLLWFFFMIPCLWERKKI